MNGIGDGPIESRYMADMKAVATAVNEYLNQSFDKPQIGFVLLVFPFNDHEGRCNYMSNANREDIKIMLREQLARFEGSPDITGNA